MHSYSPLRYPGGKSRVANFVRLLLKSNDLLDGEYVEPYAGGAGIALSLLYGEYVSRIRINDCDRAVYAFWEAVLSQNDRICSMVAGAKLDVEEWQRQKAIYRDPSAEPLALGFATFYLNRTNRSGIIKGAGVIGGLQQTGTWKMDARFTRAELVSRIARVAEYKERIALTNADAMDFLKSLPENSKKMLVYLDPPYYVKGSLLYANSYKHDDHVQVAAAVGKLPHRWIVSYDQNPAIEEMYHGYRKITYGLGYSARSHHEGCEVMFFSKDLKVPKVASPATVQAADLRGPPQMSIW